MNAPLVNVTIGAAGLVPGLLQGAGGLRLDAKTDFDRVVHRLAANGVLRQDAGITMTLARQLEHIIAEVFAAEFADYRATEFFPLSTELGPGDTSFTYRMSEREGQAAVIDNPGMARTLPNISMKMTETQLPIITLGDSYSFTIIEQAMASKANFALEVEKARAAREAIEALEEDIWCRGYTQAGLYGVTNAPGVARVTQVSTATWQAQLATAIAAGPLTNTVVLSIASDIIAMKQQIFNLTIAKHKATHCLLPPNLYALLDYVPESPLFNSKTLLKWLSEVTGLVFDYWPMLQNIGTIAGSPLTMAGGTAQNTRVMVYEKNPDVVRLMQAQTFVQLAPQPTGLVLEIPCYSRLGGAMCVRPLGMCYMDGL